jgi:uncharacterized repeat protein (TIGR02543 family)
MASSAHTYGTAAALTVNAFTRTGYAFSGWNTQADGGGTSYADEASVSNLSSTAGATVTLYAQWTPITYAVAYNANNGTGTMASSAHTYGTAAALSANAFARTGYAFSGWNTQADGGGASYADEASVSNLSSTAGATVALYAQWSSVSYSITYTLNGGTNPGTPQTNYTIESPAITLPIPTKTNAVFGGWFENSEFTGAAATTIAAGSAGNKTFYAKWNQGTVDKIAYYWVDEHDDLASTGDAATTLTKPETLTFTAKPASGGYSDWTWYLNGQPIAGTAGSDTYTFDSADKDLTNYAVGLRVKKSSKYYYTEITVTVTATE